MNNSCVKSRPIVKISTQFTSHISDITDIKPQLHYRHMYRRDRIGQLRYQAKGHLNLLKKSLPETFRGAESLTPCPPIQELSCIETFDKS